MGIERRQRVEPHGGGNAEIEQLVWRERERATVHFFIKVCYSMRERIKK